MEVGDYLRRINYRGSDAPTLATLQALHETHLLAVPFENLSIHTGEPIILHEDALYDKIVRRRRGGFCFELNGLFAALLRAMGFTVTMLSASMAHDAGEFGPDIDHLTLLVHLSDDWLADVGNGDSFRRPLRIREAPEPADVEQGYRLRRDGMLWIVQKCAGGSEWKAEYRFGLQPHALADFINRCHYYETSPDSHFTHGRLCSRATPDGRITVRDQRLITTRDGKREERVIGSEEYGDVCWRTCSASSCRRGAARAGFLRRKRIRRRTEYKPYQRGRGGRGQETGADNSALRTLYRTIIVPELAALVVR